MGLHKFAEKINMDIKEYSDIERGFTSPPSNHEWFNSLCFGLNLFSFDYEKLGKELLLEWRKPFVMQKMEE